MQVIRNGEELNNLKPENKFIGTAPQMNNSIIKFEGENNILICEENVRLINSNIYFIGNNSVVYLCRNKNEYKLSISIYNNSAFYMGRDNYINGTINIILSERKHVFIGNDGLYSFGIWIRTADPHLIYDINTKKRINDSKSIFIGDHVWIGQQSLILKGTKIHSGSIIGGMSTVAGKNIPSNTSWAGNPARQKGSEIFWNGSCVNIWTEEKTKQMQFYQSDEYIYSLDKEKNILFEEIDNKLTNVKNSYDKYLYLKDLTDSCYKNRFADNLSSNRK